LSSSRLFTRIETLQFSQQAVYIYYSYYIVLSPHKYDPPSRGPGRAGNYTTLLVNNILKLLKSLPSAGSYY
jgi:hypothetical protein